MRKAFIFMYVKSFGNPMIWKEGKEALSSIQPVFKCIGSGAEV